MLKHLKQSLKKIKKKIVIIGGLTNGKEIIDYIQSKNIYQIKLLITYPKEIKPPRFYDFKKYNNKFKILYTLDHKKYFKEINSINPDLIIVVGWSNIIKEDLLNLYPKKIIGFHPSDLPKNRGRSVIAWQIEEGYLKFCVSLFYLNKKVDQGNIIDKNFFKINKNQYVNDVLTKIDKSCLKLIKKNLKKIVNNKAKSFKQNEKNATYRNIRNHKNSLINWNSNHQIIINKIRAISKPYPGAIAVIDKSKYKVWKARLSNIKIKKIYKIGEIIKKRSSLIYIRCKDKIIILTNYEKIR